MNISTLSSKDYSRKEAVYCFLTKPKQVMYLKFPEWEAAQKKRTYIWYTCSKIHTHLNLLPASLCFCLRFVKFEVHDNHGRVMVELLQNADVTMASLISTFTDLNIQFNKVRNRKLGQHDHYNSKSTTIMHCFFCGFDFFTEIISF